MRSGILAARTQQAQERMVAAAEVLADRFGLADAHAALAAATVAGGGRNPALAALRQREAMADLLEALVDVSEPTAALPPQAARLAAMTAAEVRARIDATDDPADLDALAALEGDAEHGKHRSTVHRAIDKRRQQLAADAKEADAATTKPDADYTEAGG